MEPPFQLSDVPQQPRGPEPVLPPAPSAQPAIVPSITPPARLTVAIRVYRPPRIKAVLSAFLGSVGFGVVAASATLGLRDGWAGVAFGVLLVWISVGGLAALLGSWCAVGGDEVRIRTFSWIRFRTFTVGPGVTMRFEQRRVRLGTTTRWVSFVWPDRRTKRCMNLNVYCARDRAAMKRALQRLGPSM